MIGPHEYELPAGFEPFNVFVQYATFQDGQIPVGDKDVGSGAVRQRYPAAGARILHDVAADAAGDVYVSDMPTNRIYRLLGDRFELWLEGIDLENPNGLRVVGDTLYVGSWGVMGKDFATPVPGRTKTVSLRDQRIADFAGQRPVGNLDGIEVLADGRVLASDWMRGGLLMVNPDGTVQVLDRLAQGSADIGYVPAEALVLVPMMKDGKVLAFRLRSE